ncbi:hypothetical protein W97_02935 [Coniosporium apollinis CBS 100218]|uniref:Transmembrane protein n=1 Tax=Coniosporium apollinis (strain CBS 100218) TaxID=1168221 RepID=R7YP84_CONA1|nr:uncharacterized protein W97_02935 [Coniosporium apollinis CBS 100218]EON63707.1 hypothetical protein W97_02935 [Coniosporium apollinis CBS 100218]
MCRSSSYFSSCRSPFRGCSKDPTPSPTNTYSLLTPGLIIAASVLVAAGIAFYENPQVRQWVDQSRRKIAIALYSLGDELQPERSNNQSQRQSEEHRRRRREEIVRRNRRELIRRAQEEGVAVDLDELERVGREAEEELGRTTTQRSNASRSFDELVGSDGRLHQSCGLDEGEDEDLKAAIAASLADMEEQQRKEAAEIATALEASEAAQRLRRRGAGARGLAAGAAFGNPFADDDVQLLFDQELIDIGRDEAPHAEADTARVSRESTETLAGVEVAVWSQLVDTSEPDPAISVPELPQVQRQPEMSQISSVPAISEPLDASYASFHSTATGPVAAEEIHSTGTLTPTEDGFSTAASLTGSNADDVAVLASVNGSLAGSVSGADQDGRSEAGFSEGGFSEVSAGVMTPSSWSEIGSDEGSEWNQGHGQGVAGH